MCISHHTHKTSVYTEDSLPTHVSGLRVLLGAVCSVEAQLSSGRDSCLNLDISLALFWSQRSFGANVKDHVASNFAVFSAAKVQIASLCPC